MSQHAGGRVAPGFGAVADAFERNFTERGEVGAAFAANGKDAVLVRHVVSHTAGLPGGYRRPVAGGELLDDRLMARLLADEALVWEPGSTVCYHLLTYGWLCGELVRRVDGRGVGAFFADEVAAPLGLEVWIGLPAGQQDRVATLELAADYGKRAQTDPALVRADPVRHATWGNPPILVRDGFDWNAPEAHRAGIPGAGAVGAVRSIARLYGCLARGGELDGVRLLTADTVERGARPLARGHDPLTDMPCAFGTGFALQTDLLPFGPPPDAFGHGGAGGSVHAAWPTQRIGFSYAMNQMRDDDSDQRPAALIQALFAAAVGAEHAERSGRLP